MRSDIDSAVSGIRAQWHLVALEDPAAVDAAAFRIRSRLANHTKENFNLNPIAYEPYTDPDDFIREVRPDLDRPGHPPHL